MLKNMETNTCNANNNHLGADALLPPRKRLLAGYKRHKSDVNSPSPSKDNVLLNNPLMARLSNPNLSIEDIVETSRIAAVETAKVAEAAKAKAEEKAAKAAKAVTAAKNALDLVVTLSDETSEKEKCPKKNKMKKHATVEELYNKKNKGNKNCRTDEELARNLHRAINSSPRISKNSDAMSHKHKKLKSSDYSGGRNILAGNGNGVEGNVDSEGSINELDMVTEDLITSRPDKHDHMKMDIGEKCRPGKNERTKLGNSEMLDSSVKKRGRVKQKKLPLSICSFRDQTGPREELKKSRGVQLSEDINVETNRAMFTSDNNLVPVERTSVWKCRSLEAAACIKRNKVTQL